MGGGQEEGRRTEERLREERPQLLSPNPQQLVSLSLVWACTHPKTDVVVALCLGIMCASLFAKQD